MLDHFLQFEVNKQRYALPVSRRVQQTSTNWLGSSFRPGQSILFPRPQENTRAVQDKGIDEQEGELLR